VCTAYEARVALHFALTLTFDVAQSGDRRVCFGAKSITGCFLGRPTLAASDTESFDFLFFGRLGLCLGGEKNDRIFLCIVLALETIK